MNLVLVTAPAEEPISLATAKMQARVDGTAEDALMGTFVAAAREKCEEIARRAFVTQTLRLSLDDWPDGRVLRLPRPPLQSVTSVKYTDVDGVEHTLSASDYVVDADSQPGRIALKNDADWPSDELREVGAIKITFVAGYGAASAVPKKYQTAVQLLAAHLYENRDAGSEVTLSEIPFGVTALASTDKGWYG